MAKQVEACNSGMMQAGETEETMKTRTGGRSKNPLLLLLPLGQYRLESAPGLPTGSVRARSASPDRYSRALGPESGLLNRKSGMDKTPFSKTWLSENDLGPKPGGLKPAERRPRRPLESRKRPNH